jgi:hypothetical protein
METDWRQHCASLDCRMLNIRALSQRHWFGDGAFCARMFDQCERGSRRQLPRTVRRRSFRRRQMRREPHGLEAKARMEKLGMSL